VVIDSDSTDETYAVADFNHNGKMDLLLRNRVLLDGTTMSRTLVPQFSSSARSGVAARFNGDAHLDVVFTEGNKFRVYFGDGQGNFTNGPATTTRFDNWQLRTADMNRDGRADVIALSRFGGTSSRTVEFATSTRVWNDATSLPDSYSYTLVAATTSPITSNRPEPTPPDSTGAVRP